MKTSSDPRHLKRRELIKALFAWGFTKQEGNNPTEKQIIGQLKNIDSLISQSAPEWPIDQINRVDLAILRLAVFELAVLKKEPSKVIIDEAVELAKEFGGESSPGFVNGALGTILKFLNLN